MRRGTRQGTAWQGAGGGPRAGGGTAAGTAEAATGPRGAGGAGAGGAGGGGAAAGEAGAGAAGAGGRYTIGRLAKLTGVPVRTIRFYSDSGVLPPVARTAAGYRLYDDAARARLELVRSLRELGLDLETIKGVMARRLAPADAARVQLEAVQAQLRALTRVRSVLRAALEHGDASAAYLDRLHRLAWLTAAERAALVDDFLDRVSDGVPWQGVEAAEELRRMALPDLPDDPSVEQLDAWLELATIATDPDFQERLRGGMTSFWSSVPEGFDLDAWHEATKALTARACEAIAAGIAPDDPAAARIVDAYAAAAARAFGRDDSPEFRAELVASYEAGADPRAGRYWELVAVINGWDGPSPGISASLWLLDALRHATGHAATGHAATGHAGAGRGEGAPEAADGRIGDRTGDRTGDRRAATRGRPGRDAGGAP